MPEQRANIGASLVPDGGGRSRPVPLFRARRRNRDPRQIWLIAGAAGGYRTYDLPLTKGVLYH